MLKRCKDLTSLMMGSNFKGETIPHDETFDSFGNLQVLTIDDCPLTGQIPLWISKLAKLEMLDLSLNQLTGQIPSWIDELGFLFFLDISSNKLTGDIPAKLLSVRWIVCTIFVRHDLTRPSNWSNGCWRLSYVHRTKFVVRVAVLTYQLHWQRCQCYYQREMLPSWTQGSLSCLYFGRHHVNTGRSVLFPANCVWTTIILLV